MSPAPSASTYEVSPLPPLSHTPPKPQRCRAELFTGDFPELGAPVVHSENVGQRFRLALEAARNMLAGGSGLGPQNAFGTCPLHSLSCCTAPLMLDFPPARTGYDNDPVRVVDALLEALDDPTLALAQWEEAYGVVQVCLWHCCGLVPCSKDGASFFSL